MIFDAALTIALVVLAAAIIAWMLTSSIGDFSHGQGSAESFRTTWRLFPYFLVVLCAAAGITFATGTPRQKREPIPCGHRADLDIRDGLCYKFVPLKYQRH